MPKGKSPEEELLHGLGSLFQTGHFADLTIICGDEQHRVHKAIVCSQSAFFMNAVKNSFKEALESTVRLQESSCLVELMVIYLYMRKYPNVWYTSFILTGGVVIAGRFHPSNTSGHSSRQDAASSTPTVDTDSAEPWQPQGTNRLYSWKATLDAKYRPGRWKRFLNLVLHARMYALGSKYFIEGLQTFAAEGFMDGVWGQSFRLEDLAASKEAPWLRTLPTGFVEAAKIIYESTPECDRTMRDIVVQAMVAGLATSDSPQMQRLMEDVPQLATEIFRNLAAERRKDLSSILPRTS